MGSTNFWTKKRTLYLFAEYYRAEREGEHTEPYLLAIAEHLHTIGPIDHEGRTYEPFIMKNGQRSVVGHSPPCLELAKKRWSEIDF